MKLIVSSCTLMLIFSLCVVCKVNLKKFIEIMSYDQLKFDRLMLKFIDKLMCLHEL